MFKKFVVSLALLILIPCIVYSGTTGKISGKVVDKATGDPLPGANVIIVGTDMGAATDVNGEYFILNVPAGTYTIKAEIIGYIPVTNRNIRVLVDLTTKVNFEMEPTVLLGKEIIVEAERPLIQPDITSSRSIVTAEEIRNIPLEEVQNVVNLSPGFVAGHARGGRSGEVVYHIDGMVAIDPMYNSFDTDIPEFSVEEVSVITGGMSAEYSNAQSGIVNVVTKEGTSNFYGRFRYRTSDFGKIDLGPIKSDHYRLKAFEFSFGGPEPITTYFLTPFRDKVKYFIAGEFRSTNGRFRNQDSRRYTLNGKFTVKPAPSDKITFSGLYSLNNYGTYSHVYSKYTYEDRLPVYVPDPNNPSATDEWYGNNRLDTEDLNGNGVLDPGEDINFNGILDSEDLNHDGKLNVFDMLDNLPDYNANSDYFSINWSHAFSEKSFLEIQFGRYRTYLKYNVNERINEDFNGNGIFDLEWDENGNGIVDPFEDKNGNGVWDWEDLNGNEIWDWKVYGPDTDLFTDENNNDIIDASEEAFPDDPDKWMPWEEAPFGNTKDKRGFYWYGKGTTFYRLRWNMDEKFNYSTKLIYTNQITPRHKFKTGIEGTYYDIFDHDVDLASGGNVYGQNIHVFPHSGGAFVEDKMEYEGMIVNLGLRFDYFNPNWDKYPSDLDNPVINPATGGEVLNPRKVKAKYYWSPRLGIAYPITENDVLYFNFGRYFQLPMFMLLYTNVNWDLTGAFPLIGNPDIDPETTTSYELGIRHRFTDNIKVEAKGFYKDIKGLTDTRQTFFTASQYYTMFTNIDYGNVRGFEVTLYKRYANFIGGNVNYTYSIAKGKSSSYRQNYNFTWAGNIIPRKEEFLDWDQRHTVNATINVRVPKDRNLFGTGIFNDMGANIVVQYGSGLPYTPPQRTREVYINTARRPWTSSVNLLADKRVYLSKNVSFEIFLWVDNLLNRKNLTGIADVEWYEKYLNTQKDYEAGRMSYKEYMNIMDTDPEDGKVDENKKWPAMGRYSDPRYYSEGRIWRIGFGMEF
ncbi:MAG: TonB-dependent receptor domain-containing protein [Fidelibacterota bacterium]